MGNELFLSAGDGRFAVTLPLSARHPSVAVREDGFWLAAGRWEVRG